jgi:hypothetical protein
MTWVFILRGVRPCSTSKGMLGGLDGVVRFGLWVRGGLNDDWKVLEGIVSNEEKSDAAR